MTTTTTDAWWKRFTGDRKFRLRCGEVSEWLMVPLSKSGRRKPRGFESRPLRKALRAYGTCPSMSLTRNMKATPTAIETAISITPSAYLTRYRRLSALSCRRLSWNATRSSGLKMDVNARGPAIKMTATTALSSWAIIQSTSEYASELRREPKVTDNSRAGRGRLVRLRAQTWKVCERKLRGFESHPLRRHLVARPYIAN